MKNADLPAMPITEEPFAVGAVRTIYGPLMLGLTKREMFAMHIMSGLASQSEQDGFKEMAYYSCKMADALLAELDKKDVI